MPVEKLKYNTTLADGAIEVRDYPEVAVAEVTVSGDRNTAGNAGFKLLAGYIFGANVGRRRLAMTAPVVVASSETESLASASQTPFSKHVGSWLVRFIMPAGQRLESLPKPDDARVQLRSSPATRIATLRFSGLASEAAIQRKTEELQSFLAAHRLRSAGRSYLARYNPPWTLWFMRRNEVMIPLEATR